VQLYHGFGKVQLDRRCSFRDSGKRWHAVGIVAHSEAGMTISQAFRRCVESKNSMVGLPICVL
jgi:hypothetical protein